MSEILHHTCQSAKIDWIDWVRYNPATKELFVSFKPKGSVYVYSGVPAHHFNNIVAAKSRKEPVAGETPGSEGSYLLKHVVGKRGEPPYPFRKLSDEEAKQLCA